MSEYGELLLPYVPARVAGSYLIARQHVFSTSGLSVSPWNELDDLVFDGVGLVVLRAGSMLPNFTNLLSLFF